MTELHYRCLLLELEADLRNEDVQRCLVYVCGDRIPEERRRNITDVHHWFQELENSGNLGIDNLAFLKEILQALGKHSCFGRVVLFEDKRHGHQGKCFNT